MFYYFVFIFFVPEVTKRGYLKPETQSDGEWGRDECCEEQETRSDG